ncbi:MAG: RuBisCO large subunit C-terminal-like domain-containing protein [Fodinibius sp.]|nr:RuBisCO large subunit C-terminal-like domain-containing protein [Fodinibius sp.]
MSTFDLTYRVIVQDDEQIEEKVEGICIEQTAELPRSVLSSEIQQKVVGKVSGQKRLTEQCYQVSISWPLATVGGDISQFLNILYGNISLQPGIRIIGAEWEALVPGVFEGPSIGIATIRDMYQIVDRPLSATALKPMGRSPQELAALAAKFSTGGIDIIKDDHGLANQDFAPFDQRLEACTNTIREADGQARYFPILQPLLLRRWIATGWPPSRGRMACCCVPILPDSKPCIAWPALILICPSLLIQPFPVD